MNVMPFLFNAVPQDQGKGHISATASETGGNAADPFAEHLSRMTVPMSQNRSKAESASASTTGTTAGETGETTEELTAATLAAFLQGAGIQVPVSSTAAGADQGSSPTASGAQQSSSPAAPFSCIAAAEVIAGVTANADPSAQDAIAAVQADGATPGQETATSTQNRTAQAPSSSTAAATKGSAQRWKPATASTSGNLQQNADYMFAAASSLLTQTAQAQPSSSTATGGSTPQGKSAAAFSTGNLQQNADQILAAASPVPFLGAVPAGIGPLASPGETASGQTAVSGAASTSSTVQSSVLQPASSTAMFSTLSAASAVPSATAAVASATATPSSDTMLPSNAPTLEPGAHSSQLPATPDAKGAPSVASAANQPAAQPAVSALPSGPASASAQVDPQIPQSQTAALSASPASPDAAAVQAHETALVSDQEKGTGSVRLKVEKPGQAVQTAASESIRQPANQQGTESVSERQSFWGDGAGESSPSSQSQAAEKAESAPQSEPQVAKQEPVSITIQQQPQLQPQLQAQSQPTSAAAPTSTDSQKPALHESILAQVTEKLDNQQAGGSSGQVTIRLHPEDLGELKINVSLDDQRVKVEIVTEHPTVKEALTDNLDRLKETFSRQNLTMEKFDVSTGGGQFNQPSRQGQWQNTAYTSFNSKAVTPAVLSAPADGELETVAGNYWNPRADALVDVRF